MEFAVQMSCGSCEDAVKQALDGLPGHWALISCLNELPVLIRPAGIKNVYVNLSDEIVLVESSLPSSVVQQRLEDTGRLVVFRGYGGQGMQLYHNIILILYLALLILLCFWLLNR